MKKIFLGGPGSCDVHYEKHMIYEFLSTYYTEYEETTDFREADLIVITDTCIGTYKNLSNSINYIEEVIKMKRKDATVIVSGCLIKGVNFELTEHQKNVLKQVKCVNSNEIAEYICKIVRPDFNEFELKDSWLDDFTFPYEWTRNSISFSIVEGCNNHCSFCKSNYMNFSVKSIPYENLEKLVMGINEIDYPFNYLEIYSSNASLYGIDLYNDKRCHDAIQLLSRPECVKFVSVGSLINFYPELIKEIIDNPKIKQIYISLESGSERIYNLMNRPISLPKLISIVKLIKQHRPDILIKTELICGFPTETLDDLKRSIELIKELDIIPISFHPYVDSKQIPSSKLKQHTFEYNQACSEYVKEALTPQYNKFLNQIQNREMLVVEKDNSYYTMMLVNGSLIRFRLDQLKKQYNVNDLIEANSVIPIEVVKRRIRSKP